MYSGDKRLLRYGRSYVLHESWRVPKFYKNGLKKIQFQIKLINSCKLAWHSTSPYSFAINGSLLTFLTRTCLALMFYKQEVNRCYKRNCLWQDTHTSLLRHFASTSAEFYFNVRIFIATALSAGIVFIKQNFFFLYKKRWE